MVQHTYSRRRFLTIAAAAGAAAALPQWAWANASVPISDWRGSALGAPASIRLAHPNRAQAQQALDACVREIARLERIFSLYQEGSAINRLNQQAYLEQPPFELLEVLSFAKQLAQQSQGYFDPSIQPLYQLFAQHFAQPSTDAAGPTKQAIAQACAKVGHEHIGLDSQRIQLRPGMAISLNGVAQGYITDKIAQLLQRHGFENILLDVGEIRGAGTRPDGRPWRASIAHPHQNGQELLSLQLGTPTTDPSLPQSKQSFGPALATSSGFGSPFADNALAAQATDNPIALPRFHHLLNPHSGQSAQHYHSVTVAAPNAMLADGLSTALSVLAPQQAKALLGQWPSAQAWVLTPAGTLQTLKRPLES